MWIQLLTEIFFNGKTYYFCSDTIRKLRRSADKLLTADKKL